MITSTDTVRTVHFYFCAQGFERFNQILCEISASAGQAVTSSDVQLAVNQYFYWLFKDPSYRAVCSAAYTDQYSRYKALTLFDLAPQYFAQPNPQKDTQLLLSASVLETYLQMLVWYAQKHSVQINHVSYLTSDISASIGVFEVDFISP